jgi:hypothetical protein
VIPSRAARPGRAAAALATVLATTTAALLGSGGIALAEPPPDREAAGLIGDVNLLNNLNICPGLTAGIGLGNLLGLLGEGTANPVTNGGDVLCVIDADPDAVPVPVPVPVPVADPVAEPIADPVGGPVPDPGNG